MAPPLTPAAPRNLRDEVLKSLDACRQRIGEIPKFLPTHVPQRHREELEQERDLLGRLERIVPPGCDSPRTSLGEVLKSLDACRQRIAGLGVPQASLHGPDRFQQELEHERDLLGRLERIAPPVIPCVTSAAPTPAVAVPSERGPSNWERLRQKRDEEEKEKDPEAV